jgi:hypothetical protein
MTRKPRNPGFLCVLCVLGETNMPAFFPERSETRHSWRTPLRLPDGACSRAGGPAACKTEKRFLAKNAKNANDRSCEKLRSGARRRGTITPSPQPRLSLRSLRSWRDKHAGILSGFHRSHGVEVADALVAAGAVASGAALWTRNHEHYPMKQVSFFD